MYVCVHMCIYIFLFSFFKNSFSPQLMMIITELVASQEKIYTSEKIFYYRKYLLLHNVKNSQRGAIGKPDDTHISTLKGSKTQSS